MKKDQNIETLRGLAILLVVVGHVIGSKIGGGMEVSDDSMLRYVYDSFIDPIQIPLFTIIAGWVYSIKPPVYESIRPFVVKKIFRLMVPMLVVGLCYFFVQYVTPGTNRKGDLLDFWKLLFFPYTLFWYVYSLFFVFIIVALLDVFEKMKTILEWIVVFSISIIVLLFRDTFIPIETLNYFSYKGTLYLLPCFILGVGLNRFKNLFQTKTVEVVSVLLLVCCICIQQLSWFKVLDYVVHKEDIFGLLIGFTSGIVLLQSRIEVKWLITLGGYAYTIYLFHGFGTAGGRIIPRSLSIDYPLVIFLLSLMAGVIFPIITEKYFERYKLTRILFLGRFKYN